MEKVKLLGKLCHLFFGRYPNNTIAIEAILASDGELWCVPTINWEQYFEGCNYKKDFEFPRLCVDKRNLNHNVYEELLSAGVITKDFYLAGTGGEIQAANLTEKWQEIAKTQLKIKSAK